MSSLRNKQSKVVVVLNIPKHEELRCSILRISGRERIDSSAKSSYHNQILKCRQLIFSHPDIIASPIKENVFCVYMITHNKHHEDNSIKQLIDSIKLTIKEDIPVVNSIYQLCLSYTIIARISPLWNIIESDVLVQGRNFLSETTPLNGIQMEIVTTDGEMNLVLWPMRIKLLKINLTDFTNEIMNDHNITDLITKASRTLSMNSYWGHVLPSLKKGNVIAVTKHIPETSLFRSYKELKRHWKNMYGYRLPENEEDVIYFSVRFHVMNSNIYTYPNLCVRSDVITLPQRDNHINILQDFLSDLCKKLPTICTKTFAKECKFVYAAPKLYPSAMVLNSSGINESLHLQTTSGQKSLLPIISSQDNENNNLAHVDFPFSPNLSLQTPELSCTPYPDNFCRPLSMSDHLTFPSPYQYGINNILGNVCGQEYRSPIRKAISEESKLKEHNIMSAENFPNDPKDTSYISNKRIIEQNGHINSNGKYVPQFKKYKPNSNGMYGFPSQRHEMSHIPMRNNQQESVKEGEKLTNNSSNIFSKNRNGISHEMYKNLQRQNSGGTLLQNNSRPQTKSDFNKDLPMKPESLTEKESSKMETSLWLKNNPTKKPRSRRPQIQPEVDVEALARNKDLSRVNTATLVNWLRGKLIPCKVKDKKSDLVDKVMNFLKAQNH